MVCVYSLEQTLQLCFFLLCAREVDQEADKVALELGRAIEVLKVLMYLYKVLLIHLRICQIADPSMLEQLLGRIACRWVLI